MVGRGEITASLPDPSETTHQEPRSRGRALGIANTSSVSPSGSFPGVVLDEARRLLENLGSVDVFVFAPHGVALRAVPTASKELRLHHVPLPRGVNRLDRPLRMGFEMGALYLSLLRAFRRDRVDIFRADDTVVTGIPAVVAGRLLGIPVFVFLAGSIEETAGQKLLGSPATGALRRAVRWLEGQVFRTADGVLAVNRALASSAREAGARLVETSTSFVDAGRFPPRAVGESSQRERESWMIRYLGRLEREKGIFDILEAMERLPRSISPRIEFEYVGGGSRESELRAEIARCSLAPHVSIRGPVPHDEVPALLASTDLLLLPSYTEGSPAVVYEAMLAGVPVIATPVGSLPDEFVDGIDILFVRAGEPESLAEAIRELLADDVLRTHVREAAGVKARTLVAGYIPTQLGFVEKVLAARSAGHP